MVYLISVYVFLEEQKPPKKKNRGVERLTKRSFVHPPDNMSNGAGKREFMYFLFQRENPFWLWAVFSVPLPHIVYFKSKTHHASMKLDIKDDGLSGPFSKKAIVWPKQDPLKRMLRGEPAKIFFFLF